MNTEKCQSRHIDDLGRIVLPKDFRQQLSIVEADELLVTIEGDRLIIEKKK